VTVDVILPTYNERENIVPLIESLARILMEAGIDYQIVVVDDDSPDGTAEAVRRACLAPDKVKLILRNGQRGLATAVKLGIEESSAEVVVLMDADFSHHPQDLPTILLGMGKYDLVNGSRYLSSGGFRGNRRARIFSTVINWFLRIVLGLKTTDNTNGFVAIRRSLLSGWDLSRIFYGYGDFHFRLMYNAVRDSAAVGEVPVVYRPRHRGQAKTRFIRDGWGYIWSALKIRLGLERM
jgi:dolichol-phosphate mannosyltransferase